MAEEIALKVAFGIIAVLAIVCNSLFCVVLLANQRMLNASCNVLLFNLSLADLLTGICLFITPNYIIKHNDISVPRGIAGEVVCRFLYSHMMVFFFGIVSVYTVTCTAIERWYAVTRPHKYKWVFSRNKKCVYIAIVWFLSCVICSPGASEMKLSFNNISKTKCVMVSTLPSQKTREAVAVVEFLGRYFIPVLISCATFISLVITVRRPNNAFLLRYGNAGVRVVRMCTFTAFSLAICWFPNQLYYMLFKFNLTRSNVPVHHATVVLCMFNSCINPWVYCATNESYRKEFVRLLLKCLPVMRDVHPTTAQLPAIDGLVITGKNSNMILSFQGLASCTQDIVNDNDNRTVVKSDHLDIIELHNRQTTNELQQGSSLSCIDDSNRVICKTQHS